MTRLLLKKRLICVLCPVQRIPDVSWWHNWTMVLSSATLAAVLSLVTSIAGLPEVKAGNAKIEAVTPEEIEQVKEDIHDHTPKEK